MEVGEDFLFVKGKVVDFIEQPADRHSVIFEIERNFISHIALTDTIELIGRNIGAGCEQQLNSFKVGDTKYVALFLLDLNVVDPETIPLVSENYWRHSVHQCRHLFFEETETHVAGKISDNFSSYPKEHFDARVLDCQFTNEDIDVVSCPSNRIYPNPVNENTIHFEYTGSNTIINKISMYSLDGKLIFRKEESLDGSSLQLPDFDEKVVIVEYYCGTQKHLQKLFIN